MTLDRRNFTRLLALGTGYGMLGFPGISNAAAPAKGVRAMVLVEAATGRVLHRSGVAATRFSPCSTFKIPLALMGFDAGILKDAHKPAWDYDPPVHRATRAADKQRTDPTSWELNSVIWYSREITQRLGAERFKAYIDRLGYGNRDVSGDPGKHNGLTHSWLVSSLKISPDEQAAMVRRMLAGRLPVSVEAQSLTRAILPVFEGSGGWTVHGKTGSGSLKDAQGRDDDSRPLGWFTGWADKGKRRLVFAKFGAGADMRQDSPGGPAMREELLRNIGKLAG